ncbi:hypothetical protein RJ639_044575 [Escallonia herrerae]|uniref:Integrase zinc-binding domain-containing protein n=1 Tax=Escallonia herrerae TaxID=1293975 RepID=A0AA88WCP3_9ASTE|nr:hypothetical protein RJ639_044575 [Escallonia herrerae]
MSAVDRLFFFMEGLKPWARTELNRRRVNNLNEAMIDAENLSDYNSEPQRPPQRGNPSKSIGGKKPGGQVPNQSWGSKSSWASNSSTQQKSGVGFKAKPDASTSGKVKKPPFRGCFLCQGPHVIANCPQRQMMNAFFDNIGQVQRGAQSGSQSRHPPTEEKTDIQDYEEEDVVGAFPQWCNAVTIQVGNPKESLTEEKPKDMPPKKKSDVPGKGLMYVDIKVNGKAIRAMVDTGATHNYIFSTEVERLGLTLEKDASDFALGGVLMQECHPVAYESRKLNEAERRYTTHEKELLTGKLNQQRSRRPQQKSRTRSSSIDGHAIVRADSRIAINIGKKIRKALTRDPVSQQLLKLIESGKTRQFWQEDGLLMTKGRRVYVLRVDDLRRTLIRECHDTLWAGHAGGERTLALLQQGYYWSQMGDEVQEYVKTCLTCQQDKVERKKKAGLLQPLPVPKRLWESVIGFHHWAAEG